MKTLIVIDKKNNKTYKEKIDSFFIEGCGGIDKYVEDTYAFGHSSYDYMLI